MGQMHHTPLIIETTYFKYDAIWKFKLIIFNQKNMPAKKGKKYARKRIGRRRTGTFIKNNTLTKNSAF